MRHLNVVLVVLVAVIFLLLNIYGFFEIWRFLKETQKARHLLEEELGELEDVADIHPTLEASPTTATSLIFRENTRTTPSRLIASRYTTSSRTPLRTWPSRTTSPRTPSSRTTPRRPSTSRTTRPWWTTRTRTTPYWTARSKTTPGRTGQWTTNRINTSTRRRQWKPHEHTRGRVEHHPHRHHHTPVHKIHPLFSFTTTPIPTSTTRIHVTTNRIHAPDPSTERPRIDVHRIHTTVTTHPTSSITYEISSHSPTRIIHPDHPPHTRPTTTVPPPQEDDVTIVTALLDIGRGDWDRYRRPLEQYHIFMENLLSLQNNMVIFTDTSSYDFIHKYRKNMGEMHRTKIHLITLNDLPLARHLDAANKIIAEERQNDRLWRSIWDPAMRDHPEARSGEYNVLVNSKTYFLYNTTLEDPFSTEFFVWIDAGYGHGNQSVFPYNNKWKPKFPKNKISLIKLTPVHDLISGYTIDSLYRRNWSVISGGFVAGDKRSIGQLHTLVHRKFIELTYHNKVDDDQTVLVLVINQYPHLFSITHGDWFDAFRLFGQDPSQYK